MSVAPPAGGLAPEEIQRVQNVETPHDLFGCLSDEETTDRLYNYVVLLFIINCSLLCIMSNNLKYSNHDTIYCTVVCLIKCSDFKVELENVTISL